MHYVWWKTSDRVECSNFSVKTQGRFTPYSFTKLGSSKTSETCLSWFCLVLRKNAPDWTSFCWMLLFFAMQNRQPLWNSPGSQPENEHGGYQRTHRAQFLSHTRLTDQPRLHVFQESQDLEEVGDGHLRSHTVWLHSLCIILLNRVKTGAMFWRKIGKNPINTTQFVSFLKGPGDLQSQNHQCKDLRQPLGSQS